MSIADFESTCDFEAAFGNEDVQIDQNMDETTSNKSVSNEIDEFGDIPDIDDDAPTKKSDEIEDVNEDFEDVPEATEVVEPVKTKPAAKNTAVKQSKLQSKSTKAPADEERVTITPPKKASSAKKAALPVVDEDGFDIVEEPTKKSPEPVKGNVSTTKVEKGKPSTESRPAAKKAAGKASSAVTSKIAAAKKEPVMSPVSKKVEEEVIENDLDTEDLDSNDDLADQIKQLVLARKNQKVKEVEDIYSTFTSDIANHSSASDALHHFVDTLDKAKLGLLISAIGISFEYKEISAVEIVVDKAKANYITIPKETYFFIATGTLAIAEKKRVSGGDVYYTENQQKYRASKDSCVGALKCAYLTSTDDVAEFFATFVRVEADYLARSKDEESDIETEDVGEEQEAPKEDTIAEDDF